MLDTIEEERYADVRFVISRVAVDHGSRRPRDTLDLEGTFRATL